MKGVIINDVTQVGDRGGGGRRVEGMGGWVQLMFPDLINLKFTLRNPESRENLLHCHSVLYQTFKSVIKLPVCQNLVCSEKITQSSIFNLISETRIFCKVMKTYCNYNISVFIKIK